MQDTSSDEDNVINQPNNNFEQGNSLNETQASIKSQNNGVYANDENKQAQKALDEFYIQQLKVQVSFRFQQLQKNVKIFPMGYIGVYPPQPLVYFLPYTILIPTSQNLLYIRQRIQKQYSQRINSKQVMLKIVLNSLSNQLQVEIKTIAQLVYYRIRKIADNYLYHKERDCMDTHLIVDRLFHFYKIIYQHFYFQQVAVYFMYWAYTKRFLNQDYISNSSIKILIICLFLNLGVGIKNILMSYKSKFWQRQAKCLEMSKSNRKGQCIINGQIKNYKNYTIDEHKGLYIVSQKKYQTIREIVPIYFPIGNRLLCDEKDPLSFRGEFKYNVQQVKYYKQQGQKSFMKLDSKLKSQLSRYHLLFMLFKSMQDFFNFPNKIILDLKRKQINLEQNSQQFLLEIQHPVLEFCLSKALIEKGTAIRRIKLELNQVMKQVKDNQQAIDNVRYVFSRK